MKKPTYFHHQEADVEKKSIIENAMGAPAILFWSNVVRTLSELNKKIPFSHKERI